MSKGFYDVLGVAMSATDDQIRDAYLLRSKLLHPDRFNQTSQKKEWELANELFKELNQAYSTLRNSAHRAAYDKLNIYNTPSPPPQQAYTSPKQRIDLSKFASGSVLFSDLPTPIKDRLLDIISGKNQNQYSARTSSAFWKYALAVCLALWTLIIINMASGYRWNAERLNFISGTTFIIAIAEGLTLHWLFLWHKSPLHHWFIATPTYIIKTGFNGVKFWPLWSITNVRATHN